MDGILNLYEDDKRFFYEKKKLEIFLKTFSAPSYDFFLTQLREDVYTQLLSVLNPLFLKRDYSSVLRCLKQAYEIRDIICSLQGKISPALLFFPYCNGEICNESLLLLLSEHTERTIAPEICIDLLDNHLFLKIAHVPYPTGYIYQYKADGADDLIGSTCAELIYTDNNREYIIARVGVFLGKDKALISCIQNRKIGRIHYSIRSRLRGIENFFEIPLFFLSHILSRGTSKIIWLLQDSAHNCRIYTMKNGGFRPIYDQLGQIHKMNRVGDVFWQTEATTLRKHYSHIEGFFSKDAIQQFTDI